MPVCGSGCFKEYSIDVSREYLADAGINAVEYNPGIPGPHHFLADFAVLVSGDCNLVVQGTALAYYRGHGTEVSQSDQHYLIAV